ncbi:MAG: helix-turn-helix domain-containing protein [Tenacibaculum sp.]
MNLNEFLLRLKKILTHYSLTSSTFADAIQVQRSSISHLMSGRNKPSLDFVLKVVNQFPEVDLYWLLKGSGTFPKSKDRERYLAADSKKKMTPPLSSLAEEQKSETLNTKISASTAVKNKEAKKLLKVILLYSDGSFDEFNK